MESTINHILLIEDDPGDARLIREFLHEEEFSLIKLDHVERLKTGLEFLIKNKPDLILLDLVLPDSQGLGTFLQVHTQSPEVPIVVLNGLNDAEQAVEAIRAGAQDYLVKGEVEGGLLVRAIRYAFERKQSELVLRTSEQQLRLVSDHAPVFIAQCDTEKRFKFVNQPYAEMFGLRPSDIIGKTASEILDKEDYAVLSPYMETALTGQLVELEQKIQTRAGTARPIHAHYAPERDATGKVIGFVAAITDISELKRVDSALRESNDLNTMLLKSLPFGMDIVNHEGKILFISTSMQKILGKDVIGKRCWEMYKDDKKQCQDCPLLEINEIGKTKIIETSGALGSRVFEISHTGMIYQGQPAILEVFHDITKLKLAEEEALNRLSELEVIYASSLAINRLFNPKEIGMKVISLLLDRFSWHHAAVCQYHHESNSFELLAFHQNKLENEHDVHQAETRFMTILSKQEESFALSVIKHGQTVYSGDVAKDPRYIEIWPNIHSVITVPMKVVDQTIGFLSVSSEQKNAFSETNEWLFTTLASQTASALENARLIGETQQRLAESEAVNKISIALRGANSLDTMLSSFLDETLKLLNTRAGAFWLYDADCGELHPHILRGWFKRFSGDIVKPGSGLVGTTFVSGDLLNFHDYSTNDSQVDEDIKKIPPGWDGFSLPVRSAQAIVGVLMIFVKKPRELTNGELRVLITLTEIAGIAIQRMQLYKDTEYHLLHLQALHEIDTVIAASFDLFFVLNIILKHILTYLHLDAASIYLLNPHTRILDFFAGKGFQKAIVDKLHLNLNDGYAGRAVFERRIIQVVNLNTDSTFSGYSQLIKNEGFVSHMAVPLIVKGEVQGVLEIFQRSSLKTNSQWLEMLSSFAGQAAIAIDSNLTYNNLQKSNMELITTYDMTIEGWSHALDMRDKETEGHSERVTEMTIQLARIFSIKDEELVHIRRGALLHDMGKLGIPDSILLKPGPLTVEEWEVMRTHPFRVYELLSPIPYLRQALDIPYCHHEKWDGSGYPRGLKGNEIPLSARIFTVVDVYDALSSDRSYRNAWPKEKVLTHIKSESGKHFDPQVVNAFLRMIRAD